MIETARIDEAISFDEVGIAIGRYRSLHLKSAFHPIYRRAGNTFKLWGVEGRLRPLWQSAILSAWDVAHEVDPEDIDFFASLGRLLHVENYPHLEQWGLELIVGFDARKAYEPAKLRYEMAFLADRLTMIGVAPSSLILAVSDWQSVSDRVLVHLEKAIRRHGFGLAIEDASSSTEALSALKILHPDLARLDGNWLEEIFRTGDRNALVSLTDCVHRLDIDVLVAHVETEKDWDSLDMKGIDLFQGRYLAPPALAGALFPGHFSPTT